MIVLLNLVFRSIQERSIQVFFLFVFFSIKMRNEIHFSHSKITTIIKQVKKKKTNKNKTKQNKTHSDEGDYDYNDENIFEVELEGIVYWKCCSQVPYITIFLSCSLSELFYLCKVLEFGISSTVQNDKYNHTVLVGARCAVCISC